MRKTFELLSQQWEKPGIRIREEGRGRNEVERKARITSGAGGRQEADRN
jgi:hypothetical protein